MAEQSRVMSRALWVALAVVVVLALGATRTIMARMGNARALEASSAEQARQYVKVATPTVGGQATTLSLPGSLQGAMRQLSHEHREVLILVGAAGLTYEEAAEVCGCALGTIKSRVNRARAKLMKLMAEDAPAETSSKSDWVDGEDDEREERHDRGRYSHFWSP